MHASCHKTIPLLEDPKPLKLVDNMSEMLLGGTQSVFANWNNLCYNPIVKEQWRKRWSTVSPCFMHNLHMSGLSALWGLLNCSKSLVLTFLWVTNQTKDLILKGTWEFQTNMVGKTGGDSEFWDKARKKDLTVKNPEGDKDQDLLSGTEGDMCRRSSPLCYFQPHKRKEIEGHLKIWNSQVK